MTPSPEHTNTLAAEDRLRQVVHRLANLGQLSPLPTVTLTRRAANDNAKVRYRPSGPVLLRSRRARSPRRTAGPGIA